MARIHPTALVDASAEIAADVEIGPWSIVGPGVTLAEGVRLVSHVAIQQDTAIGARTAIHPFCVIGGDPQHTGYRGEAVRLEIGADCIIREHSSLNRGTPDGAGVTRLGDRAYLMEGSHIGHDCQVGARVTLASGAVVGGHARIGDDVFLGGLSAIHQRGRVGQGAIIGGLAAVTRDVIPHGSAWGNHARLRGLNLVGLKRKGYGKDAIRRLLTAYRDLFEGGGTFADRLEGVERDFADMPEIMDITRFVREAANRPLCLPSEG